MHEWYEVVGPWLPWLFRRFLFVNFSSIVRETFDRILCCFIGWDCIRIHKKKPFRAHSLKLVTGPFATIELEERGAAPQLFRWFWWWSASILRGGDAPIRDDTLDWMQVLLIKFLHLYGICAHLLPNEPKIHCRAITLLSLIQSWNPMVKSRPLYCSKVFQQELSNSIEELLGFVRGTDKEVAAGNHRTEQSFWALAVKD